jgi:hypothetical protein
MFTMAMRITSFPPFGSQLPVFVELAHHYLGVSNIGAIPKARLPVHLRLRNFLLFEQLQQSGVTYA